MNMSEYLDPQHLRLNLKLNKWHKKALFYSLSLSVSLYIIIVFMIITIIIIVITIGVIISIIFLFIYCHANSPFCTTVTLKHL